MIYKKVFKFLSILIVLILICGCGDKTHNVCTGQSINTFETNEFVKGSNERRRIIDKEEVIDKLCSDEYKGRLAGSLGNKLVGDYIAELFYEIGLESMFGKDYKHKYEQEINKTYDNEGSEVKTLYNVVGKIDGRSDNAVIISAHFDHLGVRNGEILQGALDDASGIAAILDLAERLNNKYSAYEPKFDIIFCAFNSEEIELKGSRSFIHDIKGKYDNLIDINIDCVGYKGSSSVTFLGGNSNSSLYDKLKRYLERNGLEVELTSGLRGSSDSSAFERAHIPSVCIIDKNVKDVIHTRKDIPEMIDYDRLDKIVKSVFDFVVSFEM